MPNLNQLKALREVGRCGSFSDAADALDYTQPAISRLIGALEKEIGVTLVDRAVRPLCLTDAGEALATHADAVFEHLASAAAEVEAIAGLNAGRLRIGTFSSAGATLVVQAVAEFQKRRPGIELSIIEGGPQSVVESLRQGKLDLGVIYDYPNLEPSLEGQLELRHLLDDPDDVLLHPEHRLARRKRLRIADLANERWLFPTLEPEHPTRRLVERTCANAGFEPRIAFSINDCEMTQAMVAAGVGVALLPRLAIHPLHPGVAVRALDGPRPNRRIAAAWLRARHRPPAAAEFVELLEAAAARYPRVKSPARR